MGVSTHRLFGFLFSVFLLMLIIFSLFGETPDGQNIYDPDMNFICSLPPENKIIISGPVLLRGDNPEDHGSSVCSIVEDVIECIYELGPGDHVINMVIDNLYTCETAFDCCVQSYTNNYNYFSIIIFRASN